MLELQSNNLKIIMHAAAHLIIRGAYFRGF